MPTDLEKLEEVHEQLRSARALLPQMIRKLAFTTEDQGSTHLFQAVAQDLLAWKAASESLETKFKELKPLVDELNGKEVVKQENGDAQPSNDGNTGTVDLTGGEYEFLDLSK